MNNEKKTYMREVHVKIGRNLLLFQKIEARLRIISPYLCIDGEKPKNELPNSIDKLFPEFKPQLMLGNLLKKMKKIDSSAEFIEFSDYLTFVHKERNSFIHDLENHPEFGTHTVNQCKGSIKYLDRQHNMCSPLLALVDELSKTAVRALSILDESKSSS